ncbi:MAG: hypothetical protein NVS3B5_19590 [Sphingomicrobium sp.]
MLSKNKLRKQLFTPRQMEFYKLLDGKGDVLIRDLFTEYYDDFPQSTQRKMQQRLSFIIHCLNGKLWAHNKRIVPGIARGTYRLVNIKPR